MRGGLDGSGILLLRSIACRIRFGCGSGFGFRFGFGFGFGFASGNGSGFGRGSGFGFGSEALGGRRSAFAGAIDGAFDLREGGAGVLEEAFAGGEEGHAARGAEEETHAELVFEAFDLAREGRLRDAEALGGAADVPLFGDGDEVAELREAHAGGVARDAIPNRYWIAGGGARSVGGW